MEQILSILSNLQDLVYNLILKFPYFWIFVFMTLESSFFPFPSEIVMIPAGYLAFKWKINLFIAILVGVLGSIVGALINYYLAKYWREKFLKIKFLN